ncbi:hypothetical protein HRbin12_01383 [bacterium HR12]|nr:hypothetical protein HRbin12_01383 [bacterium HR12]
MATVRTTANPATIHRAAREVDRPASTLPTKWAMATMAIARLAVMT